MTRHEISNRRARFEIRSPSSFSDLADVRYAPVGFRRASTYDLAS